LARSYRTHCISQAETQKLLAPSLSSFRTSSKIVNSHDHEHWEVRKFRKVLRSKVGNLVASAPRERNLPSGAFLEANLQQPNSAAITTNGPLQEELVLIVILFILFFGNQLLRRGQWQAPASFNEDYFSEWPGGRRPLSTTWPWNVKPSLLVIWGVCWMFYYANEELRRRRPRSEPNATTGAGPVMNIPIRTLSAQQYGYETGAHSLTSSGKFCSSSKLSTTHFDAAQCLLRPQAKTSPPYNMPHHNSPQPTPLRHTRHQIKQPYRPRSTRSIAMKKTRRSHIRELRLVSLT
jgi:hypothetical protein